MNDENLTTPAAAPLAPINVDREVGILRKIVSAISTALKSEPALTGFPKTAAECIKRSGQPPCSAGTWEEIQHWHAEAQRLDKIIGNHTPEKAVEYYHRHVAEHSKKIFDGATTDVEIYSIQEITQRFDRIVNQAQEEKVALYKKNLDVARVVSESVGDIVKKTTDRLAASEKQNHADWGVPLTGASPLVQHLRATEKFVRQMTQGDAAPLGPDFTLPYFAPLLK